MTEQNNYAFRAESCITDFLLWLQLGLGLSWLTQSAHCAHRELRHSSVSYKATGWLCFISSHGPDRQAGRDCWDVLLRANEWYFLELKWPADSSSRPGWLIEWQVLAGSALYWGCYNITAESEGQLLFYLICQDWSVGTHWAALSLVRAREGGRGLPGTGGWGLL